MILLVLMGGIITSNILEKRMLENSRKAVESIYEDRLQPSTDFFEMRQLIANRMFLLERLALEEGYSKAIFEEDMKIINEKFDVLMARYEKTFLVPEEEEVLEILKRDIQDLNDYTAELVTQDPASIAKRLEELRPMAEAINKDLSELSKVQSKIGQEILSQYIKDISISNILNSVQIILAILIGLVVFMLFSKTKITLTKVKDYNLN